MPFPETADIETASDDYASRFAGPAGEWMLSVQEGIALSMLGRDRGATVLDVGGGHGQLAHPLSREGFDVTVLGSDESCRNRVAGIVASGRCRFLVGNVVDLPFAHNEFDHVIAFRLLPHCGLWPELIGEMCRVAGRSVVVDYPTTRSLNAAAPALFGAKKRIEGNTRNWRMFSDAEIRREFAQRGFTVERRVPQFFLPMVLHRALRCATTSRALEAMCRSVGLTRALGSPVIVQAAPSTPRRQQGSSHAGLPVSR